MRAPDWPCGGGAREGAGWGARVREPFGVRLRELPRRAQGLGPLAGETLGGGRLCGPTCWRLRPGEGGRAGKPSASWLAEAIPVSNANEACRSETLRIPG